MRKNKFYLHKMILPSLGLYSIFGCIGRFFAGRLKVIGKAMNPANMKHYDYNN